MVVIVVVVVVEVVVVVTRALPIIKSSLTVEKKRMGRIRLFNSHTTYFYRLLLMILSFNMDKIFGHKAEKNNCERVKNKSEILQKAFEMISKRWITTDD